MSVSSLSPSLVSDLNRPQSPTTNPFIPQPPVLSPGGAPGEVLLCSLGHAWGPTTQVSGEAPPPSFGRLPTAHSLGSQTALPGPPK